MSNWPKTPQAFLSHLEERNLLPPEAVRRVRMARETTGQPIDIVLRELGLLPEAVIVSAMAEFFDGLAVTKLLDTGSNELLGRLGQNFATEKIVLPQAIEEGVLILVVADPFDGETIDAIQYFFEVPVRLHIAPRAVIEDYLKNVGTTEGEDSVAMADTITDHDLERLQDIARDAPVVKFVARIIQKAVDDKATDIHIEPDVNGMRVRFRRDGMLTDAENAPKGLHAGVISRLKILARLNIAERRLPQDGRVRLSVRGQEIDFRLSVVPTIHGETVVLRILDRETVKLDLAVLGYDPRSVDKVRSMVNRPNGMVLVTGPTGSGKTTTLYSILAELNRPEVKIFTVEDPVEYRMSGLTQLQVDTAIGLTFAAALRSVLRQDPDIILVGEIRDRETAEIAIQAALTGHLVLSTLHTNNAVGSFSRLRDMGIEPFLIDATVRGVVAQRLVRKCCTMCRDGGKVSAGCGECGGTGFRGRQATFEILPMSDRLRQAVVAGQSQEALTEIARIEGMVSMRDHAFQLATDGLTTLAEAMRVVELDNR